MPIGSLYTDLSGSLGCARGTLFSSDDDEINDLRSEANLAAWYDASNDANLTVDSVGRVSQWNDTSTFASRHLLQGTAGSQPIYLPWSGQNYGYLPGVAANYFSTPDSAAVSVTGDIDIRCKATLANWSAPASTQTFAVKWVGAAQRSFIFRLNITTGLLNYLYSRNGSEAISAGSTVGISAAAGSTLWVRVTSGSSNAAINFYTSSDGVTWTQLGTTVNPGFPGATFDSTSPVVLGENNGNDPLGGSYHYAEIRNGIDGTVVAAFDPSRATDGASSFVASTGETWTVNTSGGKPAQIVGRASVLFDGVDDFLKTGTFSLPQATHVFVACKQAGYASTATIIDGFSAVNRMTILQQAVSGNIVMYGGTSQTNTTPFAIGTAGVIDALFKGAGSKMRINRNTYTADAANTGTQNGDGLTVAAYSGGGFQGNIAAYGIALFNKELDPRSATRIVNYMLARYSIPV